MKAKVTPEHLRIPGETKDPVSGGGMYMDDTRAPRVSPDAGAASYKKNLPFMKPQKA